MNFDRRDPFTIKIVDPDNPEDKAPIKEIFKFNKELFVFTTNGIYQINFAEQIDPKNTFPESRHSYKKIYSYGTQDPIVARTFIQFKNISCSFPDLKKKMLPQIWNSTKLLIECQKSLDKIRIDIMRLGPKCDEIIEKNKSMREVLPLPQVDDLEMKVSNFFNNAKKFIATTFKLPHDLLDIRETGMNWESAINQIEKHYGKNSLLAIRLNKYDMSWMTFVSECRNALEHPEENYKVEIKNFLMMPGNKFALPSLRYNLTNSSYIQTNKKQGEFLDIVSNLEIITLNMLEQYEEVFLFCLEHKPLLLGPFKIYILKYKDEEIKKDCPVKYYAQPVIIKQL